MNWHTLFDPMVSSRLCLTLLHSFWQVALLAMVAATINRLWRRQTVECNYALHVGALVLGLAVVPINYAVVGIPNPSGIATDDDAAVLAGRQSIVPPNHGVPASDGFESEPQRARRHFDTAVTSGPATAVPARQAWLDMGLRIAPWLSGMYAMGVALMLLRLALGIVHAQQLVRFSRPITEGPVVDALSALSRQWSVLIVPALARSEYICVPKVVGLLKPTILLPAAALTGLSTSEMEMILAHELAHVRRYDMWVNLLQKLAEVVLFFNPALWYLSRRIDLLREYCCDECTCREMSATGPEPRMRYATALLRVVEVAKPNSAKHENLAALAASGRSPSELRRRVTRLLGEPQREPARVSLGGVLAVAAIALLLVCGSTLSPTGAQTTDVSATAKQQSAGATRQFSFGSEVEILAIGSHGETPQRWWDASGNPMKSVDFTWKEVGTVISADPVWRRVVFQVHDLPDTADVKWELTGSRASAESEVALKGEHGSKGYFARYFGVAEDQEKIGLRVGVATGPWKTVTETDAHGPTAFGLADNKSLVFSASVEVAEGTVVVVSHNYFDHNVRVIAVDKQGTEHASRRRGWVSAGQISQMQRTFRGLGPDDIDRFEFQVRDYEWVEIVGLPLESGPPPTVSSSQR